jgi:hypothetical protein
MQLCRSLALCSPKKLKSKPRIPIVKGMNLYRVEWRGCVKRCVEKRNYLRTLARKSFISNK